MKKLIIFTIMLVLVTGSFNASAKVKVKDVVGDWKYEVPSAPYGFEKGTLAFAKVDGKLAGNLILMDGTKIQFEGVKLEKDVLSFNVYVEGGYVGINTKIEGETMSGVVVSPQGDMKLTAQKVKKE